MRTELKRTLQRNAVKAIADSMDGIVELLEDNIAISAVCSECQNELTVDTDNSVDLLSCGAVSFVMYPCQHCINLAGGEVQ